MPHGAGDSLVLAMLGLLVIGIAWLASELRRLREQIEPLATSPLVQLASRIGS